VTLTLEEHISLITYYSGQALIHIKAEKYYEVYIELDEVKTQAIKAQELIKNNFSDTTKIPASLEKGE
jgi:hypothetical protein